MPGEAKLDQRSVKITGDSENGLDFAGGICCSGRRGQRVPAARKGKKLKAQEKARGLSEQESKSPKGRPQKTEVSSSRLFCVPLDEKERKENHDRLYRQSCGLRGEQPKQKL